MNMRTPSDLDRSISLLLGFILIETGRHLPWEPLMWVGIPVFLAGLVIMGRNIWTGCQQKTLTGWRLGLKICGLVLGLCYVTISVVVALGVESINIS